MCLPMSQPKGIPRILCHDHHFGSQERRLDELGYPLEPGLLVEALQRGLEARRKFIEAMLEAEISLQIGRMRIGGRNWTQDKLAELCGWAGSRVSYLEGGRYTSWPGLKSLVQLAGAFGVGLQVRFVPVSQLIQDRVELGDRDWRVRGWEEERAMLEVVYGKAVGDGAEVGAEVAGGSAVGNVGDASPEVVMFDAEIGHIGTSSSNMAEEPAESEEPDNDEE